jgi:hypothetical protein
MVGHTKIWHGVACRVKCARGISACGTKTTRGGYWRYQNCDGGYDTKVVRASYSCDKEVIHSGYKCVKHDLPCVFLKHGKYGFIG